MSNEQFVRYVLRKKVEQQARRRRQYYARKAWLERCRQVSVAAGFIPAKRPAQT